MNICLFSEEEINRPLLWQDERAQHLIKILHKKEGDSFTAGIIDGKAGSATVLRIVPKTQIEFSFTAENDGKPPYPLSMIIGFPRPIQLRRLLRDAAGLGVKSIHLTGTELGEKSYLKSTLIESDAARKMLIDGTSQAGSTHLPELCVHSKLEECLDSDFSAATGKDNENSSEGRTKKTSVEKNSDSHDDAPSGIYTCNAPSHSRPPNRTIPPLKIALDNINAECSLSEFLKKNKIDGLSYKKNGYMRPIVAAIGSERGWTDNERRLFEKAGFTLCSMGSRILRTETAATVAASVILDHMGLLD
ncbi:RsmE family RNA methyltransferase [Treponema parvum]|uniref:RsmE family RNA methyltransferase n=1 Tax=Treponema parvum TaxID=138851 RepID=UPI001FE8BFD0|nr:RsmE family RNA methyltransferase [Treponema parvum]